MWVEFLNGSIIQFRLSSHCDGFETNFEISFYPPVVHGVRLILFLTSRKHNFGALPTLYIAGFKRREMDIFIPNSIVCTSPPPLCRGKGGG